MTDQLAEDPTLDEIRAHLAPQLAAQAAFDGWTDEAIKSAAQMANVDEDLAGLAFSGPVDMIDAWFASVDARLSVKWSVEKLAEMKIRERISTLVLERLKIVAPDREALRRALSILALPQNLPTGAKLAWRAADHMWRLAGDTATDYNHYSKRATLSAVYGSTVAVFLDDDSDEYSDTRAFLDRRIENIMQFEKAKAKLTNPDRDRFSLSQFLGRLRYRTD